MGGFRAVALVAGLSGGVCGCTSHTTTLSPFVRNIQTSPQGVIVDSCVVEYQIDRNYFEMLFSHSSGTTKTFREGQCYRQVVPTEGVQ